MFKYGARYRKKIDRFFIPSRWWTIWGVTTVYFSYMMIFYVASFVRHNYSLPGQIAFQDMAMGKLFFFMVNIPLVSFTCLFTGHLMLGLYKRGKLNKK